MRSGDLAGRRIANDDAIPVGSAVYDIRSLWRETDIPRLFLNKNRENSSALDEIPDRDAIHRYAAALDDDRSGKRRMDRDVGNRKGRCLNRAHEFAGPRIELPNSAVVTG